MMKRLPAIAIASVVLIAASVRAAPFDDRVVASSAKFIAFIDLEAGRKTALGGWAIERLHENPGYQQFEDLMLNAAGFMPASDIRDFTIYGEKYGQNPEATLVIHANIDSARLANALSFAKGFDTEAYNGHSLMNWVDEKDGKRIHACIVDEQTIVMTGNVDRLKTSIDVLDDPVKALAQATTLPTPKEKDAWAFAVGIDLGSAPAIAANEVLSGFVERASIGLAEKAGDSILTLTVVTESPEQAKQALVVVDGAKAMAGLMANRRQTPVPERAKLIGELMNGTTTQVEGNNVSATLKLKNERATEILSTIAAMRDKLEP